VIQILTGVAEYPMIPPGAVILLAAALLVSLLPWRWAPGVGVALAILILVGAFVTPGTGNRLSEPGEIDPFIGTSVQMLGLLTAVVAGIVVTVQNYRIPARGGSQVSVFRHLESCRRAR
jgi:hypothetical protein